MGGGLAGTTTFLGSSNVCELFLWNSFKNFSHTCLSCRSLGLSMPLEGSVCHQGLIVKLVALQQSAGRF